MSGLEAAADKVVRQAMLECLLLDLMSAQRRLYEAELEHNAAEDAVDALDARIIEVALAHCEYSEETAAGITIKVGSYGEYDSIDPE